MNSEYFVDIDVYGFHTKHFFPLIFIFNLSRGASVCEQDPSAEASLQPSVFSLPF